MNSWQKMQYRKNAFNELMDLINTTGNMPNYSESYIAEDIEDWRDWVWDVMELIGEAFDYSYFRDYRRFVSNNKFKTYKNEVSKTLEYLIILKKIIKETYNMT